MFKDSTSSKYAEYLSLGTEIALSIAGPILIGFWIDSRFETSPLFILLGILMGMILLMVSFYRIYKKFEKRD